MKKYLIFTLAVLLSFQALSADKYFNIDPFIGASIDNEDQLRPVDIGYIQTTPQYEENQDPKSAPTLEFYFGEFDGSEKSIQNLQFIKEIIQDDKKVNKDLSLEFLGISPQGEALAQDSSVQKMIKSLSLQNETIKYELIPQTVFFNPETYQDRSPDSFSPGRKFWTFARFAAGTGPTFAALTLVEGMAPGIAASIAFWPGAASGAITYFNGAYGKFITSGSWSKWVLESDKKFAKILRSSMGLNPVNFEKHLIKNKKFLSRTKPDLYRSNPELFERKVREITAQAVEQSENRISRIAAKLNLADEYVKWFATEVAFTTFAIKIPQAVAGIGSTTSLLGAAGDILTGSTFGMLAQGPGDIAIQKRKNQKIAQLAELIKNDKIEVSSKRQIKRYVKQGLINKNYLNNIDETLRLKNIPIKGKAALLEQIKKLSDVHSGYSINNTSHRALKSIENWARSRATMLSFFSVAGVGMELMGVPAARPILIATGLGGALYYGNVSGWLSKEKLKKVFTTNYIKALKKTNFFTISGIKYRMCAGKLRAHKSN